MKKHFFIFFAALGIGFGGFHCNSTSTGGDGNSDSAEYAYAWQFLDIYFYFRDRLPQDPFSFATPVQLYESVNEPYTVYYPPDQTRDMLNNLTTSTGGLGIRIDSVRSGYLIVDVIPNTPAQEAGLQKGDTIITVNGNDVEGLSPAEMRNLLSGNIGDQKNLVVKRGEQRLDISATIQSFLAPSVFTDSLDSAIAYIYISSFFNETAVPGGTSQEFSAALQKTAWAQQTIIDLRDNPGGEINQAIQVISEFLPPDTPIVKVEERVLLPPDSGLTVDTTWYSIEGYSRAVNRSFILLTNQNTASAAEIMVASLRANRPEITTVGTTTYGKARGQAVSFTPDSGLAVVTFALLTPLSGETYDEVGIMPQVDIQPGQNALDVGLALARERLARSLVTVADHPGYKNVGLLLSMYSLKNREALAYRFLGNSR